MRRPNKIDWMVYTIFRWWWNPILVKRRYIIVALQAEFERYLKNNPVKDNDLSDQRDSETVCRAVQEVMRCEP